MPRTPAPPATPQGAVRRGERGGPCTVRPPPPDRLRRYDGLHPVATRLRASLGSGGRSSKAAEGCPWPRTRRLAVDRPWHSVPPSGDALSASHEAGRPRRRAGPRRGDKPMGGASASPPATAGMATTDSSVEQGLEAGCSRSGTTPRGPGKPGSRTRGAGPGAMPGPGSGVRPRSPEPDGDDVEVHAGPGSPGSGADQSTVSRRHPRVSARWCSHRPLAAPSGAA